ncbi:MAG TPA: vWA domain-containing protein [Polyangiaceae bacterium]|nr:vWA domain-containing protein [Polyangiaceae bacterium]
MLGIALSASAELSCSTREHPPSFEPPQAGGNSGLASGGNGGSSASLDVGDASADAALCGNQQIPAISDPPNLYFVVDRSGSMGEKPLGSPFTKYENARVAISVMLRAVGHRVRYGAAVYPALLNQDGCAPGTELFAIRAGDSPKYAANAENGPVLQELLSFLGGTPPYTGGTPTAATLRELEPTILGLDGKKTFVVLMTDGAPNCNLDLRCGVDACIPNIEHFSASGVTCDDSYNCCAPQVSAGNCVDADASEAAVLAYQKAGVDTFVVGMPGSEAYRAMLNRLAIAGNTARPGDTAYYAVSDTNELSQALRSIGAQVAISCDLPLSETPEDSALVNVYFDDQVVPKSDDDGWRYSGQDRIEFVGAACDTLTAGDVLNVQVLAGCPSVVR